MALSYHKFTSKFKIDSFYIFALQYISINTLINILYNNFIKL